MNNVNDSNMRASYFLSGLQYPPLHDPFLQISHSPYLSSFAQTYSQAFLQSLLQLYSSFPTPQINTIYNPAFPYFCTPTYQPPTLSMGINVGHVPLNIQPDFISQPGPSSSLQSQQHSLAPQPKRQLLKLTAEEKKILKKQLESLRDTVCPQAEKISKKEKDKIFFFLEDLIDILTQEKKSYTHFNRIAYEGILDLKIIPNNKDDLIKFRQSLSKIRIKVRGKKRCREYHARCKNINYSFQKDNGKDIKRNNKAI